MRSNHSKPGAICDEIYPPVLVWNIHLCFCSAYRCQHEIIIYSLADYDECSYIYKEGIYRSIHRCPKVLWASLELSSWSSSLQTPTLLEWMMCSVFYSCHQIAVLTGIKKPSVCWRTLNSKGQQTPFNFSNFAVNQSSVTIFRLSKLPAVLHWIESPPPLVLKGTPLVLISQESSTPTAIQSSMCFQSLKIPVWLMTCFQAGSAV